MTKTLLFLTIFAALSLAGLLIWGAFAIHPILGWVIVAIAAFNAFGGLLFLSLARDERKGRFK